MLYNVHILRSIVEKRWRCTVSAASGNIIKYDWPITHSMHSLSVMYLIGQSPRGLAFYRVIYAFIFMMYGNAVTNGGMITTASSGR